MIIPGTYITVRSEGLISAGRIVTGWSEWWARLRAGRSPSRSHWAGSQTREIFGSPGDFNQPEDGSNPLTAMRALSLLHSNGASSIVAVRVAGGTKSTATFAVQDAQDRTVVVLTAATLGTWANSMQIKVEAADADCLVRDEVITSGFDRLRYSPLIPSTQNRLRVTRGATKQSVTLDPVYKQVVTNQTIPPNSQNRFFLPDAPVENVAAVNLIEVRDASGQLVRRYGDGAILYGLGGDPPRMRCAWSTTPANSSLKRHRRPRQLNRSRQPTPSATALQRRDRYWSGRGTGL
jgi:hypothetical protein